MFQVQGLNRRLLALHFRYMRWMHGDLGLDQASFLQRVEDHQRRWQLDPALLVRRARDLVVAFGVQAGSQGALEFLQRQCRKDLLPLARRAGYCMHDAEEHLQSLVASTWLDPDTTVSILEGYTARGSLLGFLRVVYLRALSANVRRAREVATAEQAAHDCLPQRTEFDPATVLATRESQEVLNRSVKRGMKSLSEGQRQLLKLHAEGVPLTRATVELGLLDADTRHLRTRSSRIYAEALHRVRLEIGLAP